ncbi:MAG: hypothetical protein MjAS7_2039 [Metallosphaera javensis (ex Sakai et al. 2022)]|nr:MAG: hypothetical protein MjAS7_2039 [Metallosphaera javensis (ex Sakai et al. 2022)]
MKELEFNSQWRRECTQRMEQEGLYTTIYEFTNNMLKTDGSERFICPNYLAEQEIRLYIICDAKYDCEREV